MKSSSSLASCSFAPFLAYELRGPNSPQPKRPPSPETSSSKPTGKGLKMAAESVDITWTCSQEQNGITTKTQKHFLSNQQERTRIPEDQSGHRRETVWAVCWFPEKAKITQINKKGKKSLYKAIEVKTPQGKMAGWGPDDLTIKSAAVNLIVKALTYYMVRRPQQNPMSQVQCTLHNHIPNCAGSRS